MPGRLTDGRRTVVKHAAVASLAALSGCASLRIETRAASGAEADTTFRLGAQASGWKGLAPEQIRDERNPILRMTPGSTVEVSWVNLDGKAHRFAIEDSTGTTLVESEESAAQGATRTVTFEATQEMTTYLDPGYSVLMRGDLIVVTG